MECQFIKTWTLNFIYHVDTSKHTLHIHTFVSTFLSMLKTSYLYCMYYYCQLRMICTWLLQSFIHFKCRVYATFSTFRQVGILYFFSFFHNVSNFYLRRWIVVLQNLLSPYSMVFFVLDLEKLANLKSFIWHMVMGVSK